MTDEPLDRVREDISVHIFSVSAGMVGVCLTVIGIIRLIIASHDIKTWSDDLLAVDAILFLVACLTAYSAMRSRSTQSARTLEGVADVVFAAALLLMVAICGLIVYSVV